jgi:hypothetical protein
LADKANKKVAQKIYSDDEIIEKNIDKSFTINNQFNTKNQLNNNNQLNTASTNLHDKKIVNNIIYHQYDAIKPKIHGLINKVLQNIGYNKRSLNNKEILGNLSRNTSYKRFQALLLLKLAQIKKYVVKQNDSEKNMVTKNKRIAQYKKRILIYRKLLNKFKK